MRVVEPTLRMFLGEVEKIEEYKFNMVERSKLYLDYKKKFGQNDPSTREHRRLLELALGRYKLQISRVYDMMHDRGLTNFESGPIRKEPFYHPPKVEPKLDETEDLLYHQLMQINPWGYFYGNESRNVDGGSGGVASTEQHKEAGLIPERPTDIQSTGVTEVTDSGKEQTENGSDSRQNSESELLAQYLF